MVWTWSVLGEVGMTGSCIKELDGRIPNLDRRSRLPTYLAINGPW